MCIRDRNKAGAKMGVTIKVETNGSDGAKNILTKDEIANCDGIIVAAEKKIETCLLYTSRAEEEGFRYAG